MFNKEDLKRQLAEMNLFPWDTVFVSADDIKGDIEGGTETVLDALNEYFSDGLLVFPTHTYATVNADHYIYDPETEPPCTGSAAYLFLKREGVYRSLHPTYSVAASGRNAAEYVKSDDAAETPCPKDGCIGRLVREHAKILCIGCGLKGSSFIRGIEEWACVPDRLSPDYLPVKIKMPDGTYADRNIKRFYSTAGDVSENYGKIEEPLLAKGIARKGVFAESECLIIDAERCTAFTLKLLQAEPSLFSSAGAVPDEFYAVKKSIKISTSLLSCNAARFEDEVASVSHSDYIHIDVMDGHFVPNITFGIPIADAVHKITDVPLDVHLMVSNPSMFIEPFAKAGADLISVHYEVDEDISKLITLMESLHVRPAIALKPKTPVEVVFPYLNRLSAVLIMTVEPGFGGQSLKEECLEKARKLRSELRRRALRLDIEADGGITASNIGLVSSSGVTLAVMGTSVFREKDRNAFIDRCKG